MFYVYRYVYQNQIIYVGKTKRDLCERISEHKVERKFLPYLTADIEFITCKTHVEMDIYEKYFINLWSPILNIVDMEHAEFSFQIPKQMWRKYTDGNHLKAKNQRRNPLDEKRNELLQELEDIEEKETKLGHLEGLLEMLFDAFIEGWTIEKNLVVYEWDMDTYPLPEMIQLNGTYHGLYIRSERIDGTNTYENRIPIETAEALRTYGSEELKKQYQQLAVRRIELEYELNRI